MRNIISVVQNKAPISYANTKSAFSNQLRGLVSSNPEAALRSYSTNGTLFQIVNRLAISTSLINWRLYRKSDTGRAEERKEVISHQALKVWNKPNPFMTRQEFVETIQQHADLVGETPWAVSKVGSIPIELWPVRPDRMTPIPSPAKFIQNYVYRSPDGVEVTLTTDEVIFIRMPNPYDIYRGVGPVQSILMDLDSARYSAEWNRNFFSNSAEPGGIIQVDKRLSDPEFRNMRARWNEQHRGVSNAHRVAILEQGKWVDRKFSMHDMQFVELRNVSREVIREAFGFPKPLLGTVEDVNRANAEAAEVVFARWLIKPRLERIKQALNNDFLPMFGVTGEGVEFDYDDPVPENMELETQQLTARANAAKTLVDAGWDPSDVLMTCDLPNMRFGGAA